MLAPLGRANTDWLLRTKDGAICRLSRVVRPEYHRAGRWGHEGLEASSMIGLSVSPQRDRKVPRACQTPSRLLRSRRKQAREVFMHAEFSLNVHDMAWTARDVPD